MRNLGPAFELLCTSIPMFTDGEAFALLMFVGTKDISRGYKVSSSHYANTPAWCVYFDTARASTEALSKAQKLFLKQAARSINHLCVSIYLSTTYLSISLSLTLSLSRSQSGPR